METIMQKPVFYKLLVSIFLFMLSTFSQANEVEITNVVAHQKSDKTWTFAVTLKHGDTGWEHYANEWQVRTLDNEILATRTLFHPHVDEQPFTRNTSGVKIPASMEVVRIVARDKLHGLSPNVIQINLKTKELTAIKLDLKK